jgi:protein-tyrosine phosphatase
MRRVEPYALWLGHAGDLLDASTILEAGVRAVVDLALEEPPAVLPRDLAYCRFPLIDGDGNSAPMIRAAVETVACFLRSSTPTLVCCGAGMSRSPCIAGAAIALVQESSIDDALKLVSSSGPIDVSPGLWAEVRTVLS